MNLSWLVERRWLVRLLRFPFTLIPAEAQVPILQGKLRGKRWVAGSGNHAYWLGFHEYDKMRLFEKTIKRGDVVFDIGAHVGLYTLLASQLVGRAGRVFAFEPVPRNLFFLKEHLRINRISNVTVFEAAVADRCGETHFDLGPNSLMGRMSENGGLRVRTVGLDELASRGELADPQFMKIDVEGAELQVLAGARDMLARARPALFIDTHCPDRHQQCCLTLAAHGYELRAIGGARLEEASELFAVARRRC
jgi:FkbM family methyltransferase